MLASMSEPGGDTPLLNWSDLAVSELLPTGTVTLLLADVEGSTRLWENHPDDMATAIAQLNRTVTDLIAAHDGVRPVEQGEGDSFVAAFARASDAVACALEMQRAPLAPILLRIGVHTGEIQLRDEGNYAGPTMNRTARLRDLAHGGQTLLSGATEPLIVDRLPDDAWLTDLGTHSLRDMPRPERVVQLCHPDIRNEFPPLRIPKTAAVHNLPAELTSFIGRGAQLTEVQSLLEHNRLVTLTGAGGVGKTRLATQVAARIAGEFGDGLWYVDLAPITHPDVVPVTVARALGLPDQPGRSTRENLRASVGDRQMLVVLDNCEHLLDACATLIVDLLGACPGLTLLATSREPIGVAGEVAWRVPSLSLGDEAVELFTDRARLAQTDFKMTEQDAEAVGEICRRLDGMPLAIELAAARVRALSLEEIVDSLHDRFRVLTGGSRTAVRRQQTLRASVDWSHALLTETERILFRRLSVFVGGFDLDGAHAVAGTDGVERYQVLDQLSLLVDKSLVVVEKSSGRTRYRLLETVRQYVLEKLSDSGEADRIRTRHRDYYTAMAAELDAPTGSVYAVRVEQVESEMDNLRSAFGWSLESSGIEQALALASSMQPIWLSRGRVREGRAWFHTAFTSNRVDVEVAPAVLVRALADKAILDTWTWTSSDAAMQQAQQALTIAREIDDPALFVRALTACGHIAAYSQNTEVAKTYLAEAAGLARALDDRWRLSQILAYQSYAGAVAGEPVETRAAAEEGLDLAQTIGDTAQSLECGIGLGWAQLMQAEVVESIAQFRKVVDEVEAAHALSVRPSTLMGLSTALAHHGEETAARIAADTAIETSSEIGEYFRGMGYMALTHAALAAGDVQTAVSASEAAWQRVSFQSLTAAAFRPRKAEVALAAGDFTQARRWADETIASATGWHLVLALVTRARVAIALEDREGAERDAYDALTYAASGEVYLTVPDILECVASLIGGHEGARLFGAADAFRHRRGIVRFKVYDAGYEAFVTASREAMGTADFDAAWAEGAALSIDEAISYAQRGRGERKRPSTG